MLPVSYLKGEPADSAFLHQVKEALSVLCTGTIQEGRELKAEGKPSTNIGWEWWINTPTSRWIARGWGMLYVFQGSLGNRQWLQQWTLLLTFSPFFSHSGWSINSVAWKHFPNKLLAPKSLSQDLPLGVPKLSQKFIQQTFTKWVVYARQWDKRPGR